MGVKLLTPIERTSPSSRSLIIARHESTYLSSRGSGQWIRYRSTYSTPNRDRVSSNAFSADSYPWSSPRSFDVIRISDRGTSTVATARPTPVSLPYRDAVSTRR